MAHFYLPFYIAPGFMTQYGLGIFINITTAPCDIHVERQKRVLGAKAVGNFVVLNCP